MSTTWPRSAARNEAPKAIFRMFPPDSLKRPARKPKSISVASGVSLGNALPDAAPR